MKWDVRGEEVKFAITTMRFAISIEKYNAP